MDLIYVSLAVICIAAAFVLTKAYQKRYANNAGSLLFFPIPAAVVSLLFFLCLTGFKPGFTPFTFVMALSYALAVTTYSVLGLIIVRLGKLSVYMIFLMLGGMLIPFLYGIIFLNETLTAIRITGMIILIVSLFAPFLRLPGKDAGQAQSLSDNNAPRGSQKIFISLCVCVFVLNGCVSTISKVHQINPAALDTNQFLVWINFFNLVLSASAFSIYKLYECRRKKCFKKYEASIQTEPMAKAKTASFALALALLVTIALINCGGGMLMMTGAKSLPASVMFPMVTGGTIVLTSLAGLIFYKEKINLPLGIGLALTLMGTLLFLF